MTGQVEMGTYMLPLIADRPGATTMVFSVPMTWLMRYFKQHDIDLEEFWNTYVYDDSERIAYAADQDGVLLVVSIS